MIMVALAAFADDRRFISTGVEKIAEIETNMTGLCIPKHPVI
jgi:hypothetical protein